MNTHAHTSPRDWDSIAKSALNNAGRFWFLVAAIGQLLFFAYIVIFYGGSTVRGDFDAWRKVLPRGMIEGDSTGNFLLATHLLMAAIITFGGLLQLLPAVRARVPVLHRWNGRLYMVIGVTISLGSLYLVWVRGTVGDTSQHLGSTLNAFLILLCAALAWRFAKGRDFASHRRWALRLFLVVSGVWFFRVGLMLWLLIHQAPVGFDPDTFTGPFLTFLAFAQTLIPLAVLEIYLRAQASVKPSVRWAVAVGVVALTLAMGAGIFGAFMMMWWPRMS